ncbi:48_t:CDS:2, partial [Racocetra persica]
MPLKYYYIVLIGHTPDIYNTLEECDEQVNNFTSSYYKKFSTIEEANEEFERYQTRVKRKQEKLNSDDKIIIYTDGSHKNNQKGLYAGIGVYYEDRSKEITEPLPGDLQTNNRAELYTVIRALETCEDQNRVIEIKSDSRIDGNEIADKLARRGATIKMNESKKLSPYNAFMKTNLPFVKKNNPNLEHKDAFKLVIWFFSEERKRHRASSKIKNKEMSQSSNNSDIDIQTSVNKGHITEYIQIKLSDKQNALLDRKHRDFLKQHKFILDKNNIVEATTKDFLLELLYPEAKLANIKFKN